LLCQLPRHRWVPLPSKEFRLHLPRLRPHSLRSRRRVYPPLPKAAHQCNHRLRTLTRQVLISHHCNPPPLRAAQRYNRHLRTLVRQVLMDRSRAPRTRNSLMTTPLQPLCRLLTSASALSSPQRVRFPPVVLVPPQRLCHQVVTAAFARIFTATHTT